MGGSESLFLILAASNPHSFTKVNRAAITVLVGMFKVLDES